MYVNNWMTWLQHRFLTVRTIPRPEADSHCDRIGSCRRAANLAMSVRVTAPRPGPRSHVQPSPRLLSVKANVLHVSGVSARSEPCATAKVSAVRAQHRTCSMGKPTMRVGWPVHTQGWSAASLLLTFRGSVTAAQGQTMPLGAAAYLTADRTGEEGSSLQRSGRSRDRHRGKPAAKRVNGTPLASCPVRTLPSSRPPCALCSLWWKS